MSAPGGAGPLAVDRARRAVGLVFILNGFCFAALVARLPDVRRDLDLTNSALGLLLLAIALGSVLALPSSGTLIRRTSTVAVVRGGAVLVVLGLLLAASAVVGPASVWLTAVGFFAYGVGTSVWDVAMNVEAAAVEHGLGRTVMPRFHAGWSIGTILGAGVGVVVTKVDVWLPLHLGTVSVVALVLVTLGVAAFLGADPEADDDDTAPVAGGRSAWREPRTLAIGLMVLAFAAAEGTANDWLALALIDGYDAPQWVGVLGFAGFVTAMTTGRLVGPVLLDRFGRAPVLWSTCAVAAAGVLLVVLGGHPVLVGLGVVVWGLGASLGFPVGMSAAGDDRRRAPARVSVVATLGYAAFLAGPPLLGRLADAVGTREALLAIAVLMVPAAATVAAVRPSAPRPAPTGRRPAPGSRGGRG
ncbi:MFS transporter [Nocardioides sp. GCM10027113]|uniref:MFS transporter n=1 Tax=unclassified Nocardioides TaxID=2615069 RepID=UPI00361F9934